MQRSMRRVVTSFSKTPQRLRSGDGSGQPPTATTASAAYELQEDSLGRMHRAAAHGDFAGRRRWRWRWWVKPVAPDKTPVHLACADVVRCPVEKNCQPNLTDMFERPLLMQDGYSPLNLAVSGPEKEMVEFLQKKGADRHAQDEHESELLVENVDGENMEEPHADGAEHKVVLSSSFPVRTVDKAVLAHDTGGVQPVGEVEQEHDAEFLEDFKAFTQLRQELVDALKKQSMSEALLEVITHYDSVLGNENLQEELNTVKAEIQELEEQKLQSERCVHDLKIVLDNKEREVVASSQKLQDLLLAPSGTNATIKQLEEHVQHLEMEYFRLEATVQQQCSRTEALQRDLQASASMQRQNWLSLISEGLHSMPEETLQLRAHAEERVDHSDREKTELLEQHYSEAQQALELAEGICRNTIRVYKELKKTFRLEIDCERMKMQLHGAMRNGRVYEEREMESKINSENETNTSCSETASEGSGLRRKTKTENTTLQQLPRRRKDPATAEPRTEAFMVGDLSQQLEKESKKCLQLEAQNRDLREELSTICENHEKLEKSKCQLEEEAAKLKHHMEANMADRSRIQRYRREVGELYNLLERESKKCLQLEAQNRNLREELSTIRENHEKLEKSKCQLEEEVAKLKHHMEANMVDHSKTDLYKIEEQDVQERRQNLKYDYLVFQVGELYNLLEKESKKCLQLEAQNRNLQEELSTIRKNREKLVKSKSQLKKEVAKLNHHMDTSMVYWSQAEHHKQEESLHEELEGYKTLYLKDINFRKRPGNKLERANERQAEANTKLLQERRRNKSLLTSGTVSGGLAESPVQYSTERGHLGNTSIACRKNCLKHSQDLSAIHKQG